MDIQTNIKLARAKEAANNRGLFALSKYHALKSWNKNRISQFYVVGAGTSDARMKP
jgi:hypothetical protein